MALPTASDNPFPSLLVTEGSAPSSPAAGKQRVYIDSADHKLKRKNSSGTVTVIESSGSVATDTIFDAKGDLAVGTGADTASRLAVGSNNQVLTADSTQSTGLKWAAAAGGKSFVTDPGLRPPDSAATGDIEFQSYTNATNPTAGPGLSWGNQGSATGSVDNGWLIMNSATASGLRALLKATPGAGNFQVNTALDAIHYQNTHAAALVMLWGTPGSPTNIRAAGKYYNSASGPVAVWTTYNTSWAATADVATLAVMNDNRLHLRLEWDGTNLVYKVSPNGMVGTFVTVTSQALGLGRPDYIGVGVNNNGAGAAQIAAFSFLRFNWTADFDPTTDN
jgi:hypothetical protein